jgi:NitT/TauT family transport system ATP-binding protein
MPDSLTDEGFHPRDESGSSGTVLADTPRAVVDIQRLTKSFTRNDQTLQVLSDISMSLAPGQSGSIIGPSGCGKSTLLRILAGLELYDSGHVAIMGTAVGKPRQDVGFMFQGLALIPWRTVLQNIRLPGELLGMDRATVSERLPKCIDLVGLTGFEQYHLREISGGMRQRVALARMLMADAKLLLLDEPFSSLDELTRESIDLLFMDVCLRAQTVFLMVTHNIFEAVLMSDKVFVMSPAPARILDVVDVTLQSPRTKQAMDDPHFMDSVRKVRRILEMA